MTVKEMHIAFITYGQKIGMQNIRTVLDEEIDVFLNSAQIDKVRQVVLQNTTTAFQDKVSIRDNDISPINAIRTLYKNNNIDANSNVVDLNTLNAMFYTSFGVSYKDNDNVYDCRLIEPDKLNVTLRDFCNSASFDYPICTIYQGNGTEVCKVYSGNKSIKTLNVGYIKYPKKLDFKNNGEDKCELPDYLHDEIVQIAVNKYLTSLGSTSKSINQ